MPKVTDWIIHELQSMPKDTDWAIYELFIKSWRNTCLRLLCGYELFKSLCNICQRPQNCFFKRAGAIDVKWLSLQFTSWKNEERVQSMPAVTDWRVIPLWGCPT